MKDPVNATERLLSRAAKDREFRARLVANPKEAIEQEFGVTLAEDHKIHVHEESDAATHLVLPPRSRFSEEEREAARAGAASLEFLKKTMFDPAPPLPPSRHEIGGSHGESPGSRALAKAAREASAAA